MDKHRNRWWPASPTRFALVIAAIILAALLVQTNIRLLRLHRENASLLRSFPELKSSHSLPSIVEAETINRFCKRYYIAVGVDQRVQIELEIPGKAIDLGTIDGKSTGRIVQLWLGLVNGQEGDFINVFVEELSPDGYSITPYNPLAFATYANFTSAIGRSHTQLADTPSNDVDSATEVALLRSGNESLAWLRLKSSVESAPASSADEQ